MYLLAGKSIKFIKYLLNETFSITLAYITLEPTYPTSNKTCYVYHLLSEDEGIYGHDIESYGAGNKS